MTVSRHPEENRTEMGYVVVVEEPFVKIGMPELYAQVLRVAEGNQRLDAKLDQALSVQTIRQDNIAADHAELKETVSRLSDRLSQIETRAVVTPSAMWRGVSAIAAIAAITVAIIAVIVGTK